MDKIFDGDDFAHDHDFMNYEALLKGFAERAKRHNRQSTLKSWGGKVCGGPQIFAYISAGRWMAKCWCGGIGYVTRRMPIYFCLACGNASTGGEAVPVVFPEKADELEALLLKRPVQAGPSGYLTAAARTAVALVGPRDWLPGQSVDYVAGENARNGVE